MTTNDNEATKKMNPIAMLDMDITGKLSEREPSAMADEWLDGTLLGSLYPDIKLALLTVPACVDDAEKSLVQDRMCSITWPIEGGTKYKMIGASGSAKNGKFYFADEAHVARVKQRFLNWPEAAITYLGIQTSGCKVVMTFKNAVVAIVPDLYFGTNDCQGWIRQSWAEKMKLTPGHIYQCREAFDITLMGGFIVGTQTKGLRKVMTDDVADKLGVDMIIPESSVKPLPTKKVTTLKEGKLVTEQVADLPECDAENLTSRRYTSDVVVGVRAISGVLKFSSSYSILQHASFEVINNEILPKAIPVVRALKEAWDTKNHFKVLEMIGKRLSFEVLEDESTAVVQEEEDGEVEGYRAVECILLADGSGEITRHPYIHQTLSKLMTKWAYKLGTGGGLDLPGFMLAADGYLAEVDGKVVSGSNWLPLDTAIVSDALTCDRGLCCRYPVRCAEDLLPMKHADLAATVALLIERGIPADKASWIAEHQLCLQGTYTLHQDTAKRNGGDFDGDMICVIDGDRYPMFTEQRFTMTERPAVKKIKAERLKSMWYNLESIAMGAMGNQIGRITNLISSCIAADRNELVYEPLCPELQKEIDSLKHNTCADKRVLQGISDQVKPPLWLDLKKATSLNQLPLFLEVLPTDRVGYCYNVLRAEIDLMMGTPMQVSQFAGLIVGNTPTHEMFEECRFIKTVHFAGHQQFRERSNKEAARVKQAKEELDRAKKSDDKDAIRKAYNSCKKANNAQKLGQDWCTAKTRTLGKIIATWAASKHTNRKAWAQAMHKLVHNSKSTFSTGSLGIHAFAQEFVDAMVERTGGIRSIVATPKVLGEVVLENKNELWLYAPGRPKVRVLKYHSETNTITR